LLVESTDAEMTSGEVGLAKFRDTVAEFKQFRVGKELSPITTPADALRDRARALEQQAAELRKQATATQQKLARIELLKALDADDLALAALLVAKLDNEEIDVPAYRAEIDRLGKKLAAALPRNADEAAKLAALNKFFFEDRGFHGSRADYYHRSNSYLNEVLDDREGLPITLAVLYIELAKRVGLTMEGVGMPGHFVVRHVPAKGEPRLIDVYEGGQPLTREEAAKRVQNTAGVELTDDMLKPVAPRAIVTRILQNLLNLAGGERDLDAALRYLDALVDLSPTAGRERWMRAVLSFQAGRKAAAREDVDWLLDHKPAGVNLAEVRELQQALDRD
jgi:regulator of sirC expression with transglutaminase-like and TPR domain